MVNQILNFEIIEIIGINSLKLNTGSKLKLRSKICISPLITIDLDKAPREPYSHLSPAGQVMLCYYLVLI